MNIGKIIVDLMDELRNSNEQKTVQKIRHFSISLEIFVSNFNELKHHLEIHNNPQVSLKLMSQDNRELLHQYQKESTRLLHNYIASTLSLIDHTRIHYRELYGQNDLFPDYQKKIDTHFKVHPLSNFIKDFRQYIQHFSMPSLSSRLHFQQGAPDFEISIRISVESLNKFSGWNSKSKEFIKSLGEDFDLLEVIIAHESHIKIFYEWFMNRQHIIHKSDYEKVNEIRNKIRNTEFGEFISQFIQKTKNIEEFESELFKFYRKDDLELLMSYKNKAERVQHILHLLKSEEIKNIEFENKIVELYK
jgi:uncharacterized membrane-anchored protein YhcB (DUF1043 family)